MKKIYLRLLTIAFASNFFIPTPAQEIKWNNSPTKGFVFSITNREAKKLLKSDNYYFNYKLLHTLTDTFDVKKGWSVRPEKGHFILTRITGNRVQCNYTCQFPYQVFLLKEYNALSLQVLDLNGNVRTDARVKLGFNRIQVDSETKTYRIEDATTWYTHYVSVELEGFRSYFDITRHEVPTWSGNYNSGSRPDFYSYLITDKNKYKPGEKVRFKSYALSGSRLPVRKELEIWLYSWPKNIKLGIVSPHRPGSFAGEFILHDSLKLTLDKSYNLQLREASGRTVSACTFSYEDYELFDNKLDIQLSANRHYFPENNKLTIVATDANGLILKDAKAEILVQPISILQSFQPVTILRDTLLFSQLNLDPAGPTEVDISPDLFRKTNTAYRVSVSVLNSENERLTQTASANYYYSNYELKTRFSGDSICFDILRNNKSMSGVPVLLRMNNDPDWKQVMIPLREKINPAIISWHFKNELVTADIEQRLLVPHIDLTGGIEKDSFNLYLVNPQKLDVSWYIYQGSKLLMKGSGTEMEFKSLITDRTLTYYAELLYSFGGQDNHKRRQYEFREDYLNISLDLPERIYPGQTVDATVLVTNQTGDPVKGVDLTAMAVTSKLNYNLPDLPYYGSSSVPRPRATSYSKEDRNRYSGEMKLDFKKWAPMARLDTMIYYHFTYPMGKVFRFSLATSDSTQFVPYVMHYGSAKQIHVIEVDHIPVYFSWTNQPKGYSFYIKPCINHVITLRLSDRVITFDSLSFERGTKTILSIDFNQIPSECKVKMLETKFSAVERSRYSNYISEFKSIDHTYAYLESEKEFVPLFSKNSGNGYRLIGPVSWGKTTYVQGKTFQISYRHDGPFKYDFEENVVYKLTPVQVLLPGYLSDMTFDPLSNVNQRPVNNKLYFLEMQNRNPYPGSLWMPDNLEFSSHNSRFKIALPTDTAKKGIAAVIFRNCITGKTFSPLQSHRVGQNSGYISIPVGCHSVIILYTTGDYLRMDSINIEDRSYVYIDFKGTPLHETDSLSQIWLIRHGLNYDISNEMKTEEAIINTRTEHVFRSAMNGNVHGFIHDESNDPLPGVVVLIKGTDQGTITDINGCFSLNIEDYIATLVISYIGFKSEEVQVTMGSELVLGLESDIMMLQEVVVVGYGLQGRVAGLSSASVITTGDPVEFAVPDNEPDSLEVAGDIAIHDAEQRLYNELLNLRSIRSRFSDVAVWEPQLFTDKKGESRFTVTFPDDITRWDALVYGMNRHLQTGTVRKSIRSFKPLMAELSVPRFLTEGDSSLFSGKILNYTSDTVIQGEVNWLCNGSDFSKQVRFGQFHNDLIPVSAPLVDSITAKYTFTRNDGYLEGEERSVPVIQQGILRAEGSLEVLKNGDERIVTASDNETRTVEFMDSQLEVYRNEVDFLVNYHFLCNEQLASRLIGLVNNKYFSQYENQKFRFDDEINRIIRRLLKNQNREFLWSWWDISDNTSYWMSAHILRSLKYAKDAGYSVDLDISNVARKAEYKFEYLNQYTMNDIDLLHALATWNAGLNYQKYTPILDSLLVLEETKHRDTYNGRSFGYSFLHEKFMLEEIRQMVIRDYHPDILKYKKEGILGEVFFSDNRPSQNWYGNELASNIDAYRIIKSDSTLKDLMVPMQLYFLSSRESNWNTYQSANLLMTVLPDLLKEGVAKGRHAAIGLSGKVDTTLIKFPYRIDIRPGEKLIVRKESGLPVYFMNYVTERVTEAKTGVKGLRIKTYFADNSMELRAGQPTDLIVDVYVEKDADVEHVMIEVPIPAACSYADKRQSYYNFDTHREYFKEKTVIFCENLKPGMHSFTIKLLPRFTGKYFVNPASVSLMYIPVVNANTEMKRINVL